MSCISTNWKKRKDIDYMIVMATKFGKGIEENIGIYEEGRRDVGKVYNFEIAQEEKEYVKVIRFDKQPTSRAVLQDNERAESDVISDFGDSESGDSDVDLVGDSGGVLQEEQPDELPTRPKQSNKNRKAKKRD